MRILVQPTEFNPRLILPSQHLRASRWSLHPPLDHPRFIQQAFCRRLLSSVRRSRVNHVNQLCQPSPFLHLFRAWGVVPILLSEISPPAFRTTFPGVAYQLGNMVSSASAQIEASQYISFPLARSHPLTPFVSQPAVNTPVPPFKLQPARKTYPITPSSKVLSSEPWPPTSSSSPSSVPRTTEATLSAARRPSRPALRRRM